MIGQQVLFMFTNAAWWGPYELIKVVVDDDLFPAAVVVEGSKGARYTLNVDNIVVCTPDRN